MYANSLQGSISCPVGRDKGVFDSPPPPHSIRSICRRDRIRQRMRQGYIERRDSVVSGTESIRLTGNVCVSSAHFVHDAHVMLIVDLTRKLLRYGDGSIR